MAVYIRSVMNNSVLYTVIIEFSKRNESRRNWLDLPLLVYVCCTIRQWTELGNAVHQVLKILLSQYMTHCYSLQA